MGKDKSTSKASKGSKGSKSGHKRKRDDKTLTSASALRCMCFCGKGGFGTVYIVSIDGVSQPCVLKKLLKVGDKDVIKACRKEFKIQLKLFTKCFNRIPRPIYMLDLLDEDYKGVYGFCMEFCIGGSVKDFSRSWCVGGKYGGGCSSSSAESEDSSSDSDSDSDSTSDYDSDSSSDSDSDSNSTRINPMTLDPLRVSALCVGMIECLSEVFKAKPDLIHRDIKPDNFLVRVESDSMKFTIVLSDLGLAQIQDSISSSTTSKSFVDLSKSEGTEAKHKSKPKRSICGTLVYNSCEALEGDQSQESDAYSLGLTILAMFKGQDPFLQHPVLQWIDSRAEYVKELSDLISKGMGPKISKSRLFKTLKTIKGGKFKFVYSCLNEIFEGLTRVDIDERMSVHEACEKVQSIKPLLPKIGEGWKCPSIDDIVKAQLAKHKGDSGCIVGKEASTKDETDNSSTSKDESQYSEEHSSVQSVVLPKGWGDGLSRTKSVSSAVSSSASKDVQVVVPKSPQTMESFSILELQALVRAIQNTSQQSSVTSLFKSSSPRLKNTFDEWNRNMAFLKPLRSTSSAFESERVRFTLCFECLSLFVYREYIHSSGSDDSGADDSGADDSESDDHNDTTTLTIDESSLEELIETFLTPMIRVEAELCKIEADKGLGESYGKNTITKSLIRIVSIAEQNVKSMKTKLIPQISSVLMRVIDRLDLNDVVEKIMKCSDAISASKLYYHHRDDILAVFLAFQSKREIRKHKKELFLCVECLRLFICNDTPEPDDIYLPIPDMNDLIYTFIDHLSRCEEVLEGYIVEEFCELCMNYCFEVEDSDKLDSFFLKISDNFQRILARGSKKKLEGGIAADLLMTLRNISLSPSNSTISSILTLIKPYVRDWLRIYKGSGCYGRWMYILGFITLSSDESPNKSLCSEAWPLFHPVLDVVKREFVGNRIIEDDHEHVLLFFSNLCCDQSHALEVYDNVKDLLDGWFTVVKKKEHKRGIKYWSNLISMFSTVSSLVPYISPKYDANMEWCKNNGGWDDDYPRYLSNCYPHLKKWIKLVENIVESPDSKISSKLYHEHRDEILSVFLAFQSKNKIKKHKKEIILCIQCLRYFVSHDISESENDIYLLTPDLNDLIDTFICHLSRVEEVLGGVVDDEFCKICVNYTFSIKVEGRYNSFLHKISPAFQILLERGRKGNLSTDAALNLLKTLRNISNSSSTRSSILTMTKPYIRDWFRIYKDGECYGQWMELLSHLTLSSDNKSPNKSLCSEAWPLFHPVLDIVKREFVGDKIVGDDREEFLLFFSNLCCNVSHTAKIYDHIKDLLDGWFEIVKEEEHKWGIIYLTNLISKLSSVPSIVPHISPKFDAKMEWGKKNGADKMDYRKYVGNCSRYCSSLK
ncbi:hypothetical protein ADUPG1_012645 [Aduncisulcus paluster]|uniref:Protein kinase domain-containing protein n=1 Tax=Aduncisulcus paluster TaxID=2918883 RepID=A0ABQ5K0W4_9EUKA|nr:hypothetical protein ADUPG1_012645 [Aduncisulcus paluster]